eukprot:277869-Alexandrium_andersonii.AAC.1
MRLGQAGQGSEAVDTWTYLLAVTVTKRSTPHCQQVVQTGRKRAQNTGHSHPYSPAVYRCLSASASPVPASLRFSVSAC